MWDSLLLQFLGFLQEFGKCRVWGCHWARLQSHSCSSVLQLPQFSLVLPSSVLGHPESPFYWGFNLPLSLTHFFPSTLRYPSRRLSFSPLLTRPPKPVSRESASCPSKVLSFLGRWSSHWLKRARIPLLSSVFSTARQLIHSREVPLSHLMEIPSFWEEWANQPLVFRPSDDRSWD